MHQLHVSLVAQTPLRPSVTRRRDREPGHVWIRELSTDSGPSTDCQPIVDVSTVDHLHMAEESSVDVYVGDACQGRPKQCQAVLDVLELLLQEGPFTDILESKRSLFT